jgi:hypothetical protein
MMGWPSRSFSGSLLMPACDEAAVLDTPEKRGRPTDHIADLVAMEAAVVYEELTEHQHRPCCTGQTTDSFENSGLEPADRFHS